VVYQSQEDNKVWVRERLDFFEKFQFLDHRP
jgi:hypothetical protein